MRKIVNTRLWLAGALLASALLAVGLGAAHGQDDATARAIEAYRAMLAEQGGSPAELYEFRGEALWKQKRGPKNASLERCDLGKGPGVLKGVFVELPRFFKDTGRVQDLESRLLTCMETLQGFNAAEIAKVRFGSGEMANVTALATYVSAASRGMRFNLPQQHPQERVAYQVGKRLFYMRGGTHDFSCAGCHSKEGKRIRLQELPVLHGNPGDGIGFAAWPAYRITPSQMWSMQLRLHDCYRQMRWPEPKFASDATVALSVFLGVNAEGDKSIVPALKR